MTPEEMTASGMLINHAGYWITEAYDRKIKRGEHEEES
jgi:hypothetical protein